MSQADGSIIIDTKIDQTGLSKGLGDMQSAAVKGAAAIAAAIAAASVAVIALGSEFEQANAKASTLFGDAQVDMTQYQGKMLELSNKTGLAATELGNTMYDALSAGIPASDDMSEAMGFLEKNTKLAKAGFTDINTATTATAKVLNAYKMDVSETDRVHKVLMQTQNKGITTVNELGSVLSQVTPTASAMGVSFEQVGAALAGMTAQGTPTAQATTQLNQLIAELGKNGTQANKSMTKMYEDMGYGKKSFKELMDEGVTLVDIIVDMEGYAKDNDKSLIDMFGSLEAGKAALSMAGDNAITFTKNLEAMKTQTDVVGEAYDKVTDTFKEKSAKVVNSLKNVGIAAYSKFEKPLKKSMDVAQKSVDSLSREMSNGKLGKSVDTIAKGFGKLIEVAADLASKAIPLVVNGFSLLIDNGKLLASGIAAVSAAMLAMKAQEFVNSTILPMVDSFKIAKQVVADFNYAQQASAAFGLEFSETLTLGQAAVGLLTGKISLATAATTAWNAACAALGGPIGVVVTATAALVAGIAVLSISMDDEKNKYKEVNEEIKNNVVAYDDLKKKQEESITTNLAEIDHTKRLSDELLTLVDSNGKVKEGYEGRVSFILGELNSALGSEYSMTDGVINKYGELKKSITDLIDVQRAQIILEGEKERYTEAVKNRTQALTKLNELEKTYVEAKTINDAKIIELEKERDAAARRGDEAEQDASNSRIMRLVTETNTMKESLDNQKTLVNGYNTDIAQYEADAAAIKSGNIDAMSAMNARYANSYIDNGKTINLELEQRYANEQSKLSLLQGLRDEAMNIADKKQREYTIKAYDDQIKASQDSLDQMMTANGNSLSEYGTYIQQKLTKAKELQTGLSNNEKGITQEQVAETQKQTVQSLVEYGNYVNSKNKQAIELRGKLERHEKGITNDMVKEAENQADKANKEFSNVAKNVTDAMRNLPKDARAIFSNMVKPMYEEMENAKPTLWNTASSIAEGILGNLKKSFDIHSPSRKTRQIFKNVMLGAELSMDEGNKILLNKTDNVAKDVMEKMNGINLSNAFDTIKSAIYAEQEKMGLIVDAQAKTEIFKTSLSKIDLSSMTATVKAVIDNHVYIGDRETAHVLAPLISEEMAFQGR